MCRVVHSLALSALLALTACAGSVGPSSAEDLSSRVEKILDGDCQTATPDWGVAFDCGETKVAWFNDSSQLRRFEDEACAAGLADSFGQGEVYLVSGGNWLLFNSNSQGVLGDFEWYTPVEERTVGAALAKETDGTLAMWKDVCGVQSLETANLASAEDGSCVKALRIVGKAQELTTADIEAWTDLGSDLASLASTVNDPALAGRLYETATFAEMQYGEMKVAEINGDAIPDFSESELGRLLAEVSAICEN